MNQIDERLYKIVKSSKVPNIGDLRYTIKYMIDNSSIDDDTMVFIRGIYSRSILSVKR